MSHLVRVLGSIPFLWWLVLPETGLWAVVAIWLVYVDIEFVFWKVLENEASEKHRSIELLKAVWEAKEQMIEEQQRRGR